MRAWWQLLTPRGVGLLVVAAGAWVLSRLLGVPELQMAAVAALVLVVGAVAFVVSTGASLATTRRVAPGRVAHGGTARVEVQLRNLARLPTARLVVEDRVPTALRGAAAFVLAPVAAGGRARLRYELVGDVRGVYELGPLEVRSRDPFGIAARPRRLGDTDRVVVHPPVHRLAAGLPLLGRTGAGGGGRSLPGHTGDEQAGVREYVLGDDLRRVHWRATAHRGDLMIRQEEDPHRPDALLVLDTRADAHAGTGPSSSLETAVGAAASLAMHVAERGFDAALATTSGTTRPRPLPWEVTLDRLAAVTADPAADLLGLWQQLASGAGSTGVLLAVTCVPDPELLRRMVRAGRGAAVRVALLVDADAHGRARRGRTEAAPTVAALRAAGWHVGVVGPGDRLEARWRELLVGNSRSGR